jgi:hypothetical protein
LSLHQTTLIDSFNTWLNNTNSADADRGDIASLNTTNKTSSVAALNEILDDLLGNKSTNVLPKWLSSGKFTSSLLSDDGTNITAAGPIYHLAGNVSAPAFSFTGQADLGLYKVNATTVGFSAGGNNPIQLSSTGINIGIPTNSTGFLYLGDNTQSNIFLDTAITSNSASIISFRRARNTQASLTNVANSDVLGQIAWSARSNSYFSTASVQSVVDDTVVAGQRPASRIEFYTNLNNAAPVLNAQLLSTGDWQTQYQTFFKQVSSPALSPANEARLYCDGANLLVSINGAAYSVLASPGGGTLAGSGTGGNLAKWTGVGVSTTVGDSIITESSGKIAINGSAIGSSVLTIAYDSTAGLGNNGLSFHDTHAGGHDWTIGSGTIDTGGFGFYDVTDNALVFECFNQQLLGPGTGSLSNPTFSFIGDTDTGIIRNGSNNIGLVTNAALRASLSTTALKLESTTSLSFNGDVFLVRVAANVLSQQNSTNGQEFRVLGTTTGSHYVSLSHDGTSGNISGWGQLTLTTKDSSDLILGVSNTASWKIAASGSAFSPVFDNSLDLGSLPFRVHSGYFGAAIKIGDPQNSGTENLYLGKTLNAGGSVVRIDSAGTSSFGSLIIRTSGGTMTSRTDTTAAGSYGLIAWEGWSSSSFQTASIESIVDGTITSGQRPPSKLQFSTNISNSSPAVNMLLYGNGDLIIPNGKVGIGINGHPSSLLTVGTTVTGSQSMGTGIEVISNNAVLALTDTGQVAPAGRFQICTTNDTFRIWRAADLLTINNSAQVLHNDGTSSLPTIAFFNETNTGWYRRAGGTCDLTINGVPSLDISSTTFTLRSGQSLKWSSTDNATGSPDVILVRDSAAALALKNGTTPQEYRVYGTTTGGKYLRLSHDGTDNYVLGIGATGLLKLGSAGAIVWNINGSNGELYPAADNSQDIGDASFRLRSLFVGTSTNVGILTNATGHYYAGSNTSAVWVADTAVSSTVCSSFNFRKARGTQAALADVVSGDVLGAIGFVSYSAGYFNSGQIQAAVDAAVVSGQRPASRLEFYTNLNNTAQALQWQINSSGHMLPGTDNTINVGSSSKRVNTLSATKVQNDGTGSTIVEVVDKIQCDRTVDCNQTNSRMILPVGTNKYAT